MRAATIAAVLLAGVATPRAETLVQQCGQQYQAAKAAGTLNGMNWSQFRSDCVAKLKAQPASVGTPAETANPLNPAPANASVPAAPAADAEPGAAAAKPAATGGRAAFVVRERQCGSEWRANKTSLIAQTPGLTWPKYLSVCNKRLKAAGK